MQASSHVIFHTAVQHFTSFQLNSASCSLSAIAELPVSFEAYTCWLEFNNAFDIWLYHILMIISYQYL